jgi:hypothetical protein
MTDIIRDMICYFNGNKPSADNLLQHYVEGPNDIYDPDEVFEIAEEGCISFGKHVFYRPFWMMVT